MEIISVLPETKRHLEALRSNGKIGFLGETRAFPFVHSNDPRITFETVDFIVGPNTPISPNDVQALEVFKQTLSWWPPEVHHVDFDRKRPVSRYHSKPTSYAYQIYNPDFRVSGYGETARAQQDLILGSYDIQEPIPGIYNVTCAFYLEDQYLTQIAASEGVELKFERQEDPFLERHIRIRPYPNSGLAEVIFNHEQGWLDGNIKPNFLLYVLRRFIPVGTLEAVAEGKFHIPVLEPLTNEVLIRLSRRTRAVMLERSAGNFFGDFGSHFSLVERHNFFKENPFGYHLPDLDRLMQETHKPNAIYPHFLEKITFK